MNRLIAIDIGNTNITAGLFMGKTLIKRAKVPTARGSSYARLRRFVSNHAIKHVIVSSVVPRALSRLKKALRGIDDLKISVVGKDIRAPIVNLYKNKSQVGQDRLVNAVAAWAIYGAPSVVVDFGTAITFDIISRKGDYLGGLILPGIEISLSSLYERTALLPKVKLAPTSYIIGKETISSMRGGILFGFGAMCDGLVSRYRKILGKGTKVIATGGNASLMKRYAKSIQIVDEDLTLKGLHLISSQ